MAYASFGTVSAIDATNRVLAGALEIFLPLHVARAAVQRTPDIDEPSMVSWGGVTQDEMTLLLTYDDDGESRAEIQASLKSLFVASGSRYFTLHYADHRMDERADVE